MSSFALSTFKSSPRIGNIFKNFEVSISLDYNLNQSIQELQRGPHPSHVQDTCLKMLVLKWRLLGQGKETFGFHMCLIILGSLVSRLVPQLFRMNICFSLQSKTIVLEDIKPLISIIKREPETNLDTKFLKARHMSRPKFFYLGLPISILKPAFSSVCGLFFSPPCLWVVTSNNLLNIPIAYHIY